MGVLPLVCFVIHSGLGGAAARRFPAAPSRRGQARLLITDCVHWLLFAGEREPRRISVAVHRHQVLRRDGRFSRSKVRLAGWLQFVAFFGLILNTGLIFTQRKSIGLRKDASMTCVKVLRKRVRRAPG